MRWAPCECIHAAAKLDFLLISPCRALRRRLPLTSHNLCARSRLLGCSTTSCTTDRTEPSIRKCFASQSEIQCRGADVRRALRRADEQRKLAQQRPASEAGDGSEAAYGPLYSPQPRSPAWAHGSEADKVGWGCGHVEEWV